LYDSIQAALYTYPFEGDSAEKGWSKSTVIYLIENRDKVYRTIRGMVKNMRCIINSYDVDDLYQEILEYMSSCEDYDVSKAYSKRGDGTIVGIEGYVHSCVKFCIKRYITRNYRITKNHIDNIVKDEAGDDNSIFNYIPDQKSYTQYSDKLLSIEEICKNSEEKRYKFGMDIFTMFYVAMVLEKIDKRHKMKEVITALNIIGKELEDTRIRAERDGIASEIARAVALTNLEKAIEEIGKYVYGKESIDKLIEFVVLT